MRDDDVGFIVALVFMGAIFGGPGFLIGWSSSIGGEAMSSFLGGVLVGLIFGGMLGAFVAGVLKGEELIRAWTDREVRLKELK